MADFKRKRKQHYQTKVRHDNESNNTTPHKKRRGVSVFQRQLYKRKMWVKEYEAGKDQKRRDKRKVMRGYYRALKELDREHKQIFGHSISKRTKRIQRKNRNSNHNNYAQNNNNNNMNFQTKDVWNELKHPTYQQKYKRSNWEFMNTNNKNNQHKNYKSYRGNGMVNVGHNINVNRDTINEINNEMNNNNNNNNNNKVKKTKRRLLNSYDQAMMEHNKIKVERNEIKQQKEFQERERKKALDKFEKERKKRKKILSMRNKKGQPNLNAQIGLLLDKIKNNEKKNKVKQNKLKLSESNNNSYNTHTLNYENDSDTQIDDFLAE